MMYNEFLNGTNCKDNEYNYNIFKNLEIMYMNSDISKEQIYEYGKKLVCNDKSEREIEIETKIKAEIEELKDSLRYERERLELFDKVGDEYMIKKTKAWIREYKSKIKALKWCLE